MPSVPIIKSSDGKSFKNQNTISIATISPTDKIYYTIDGSQPNEKSIPYTKSFTIDKNTEIKTVAVNNKNEKSLLVESKFVKMPHDWTVKIQTKYNPQYTGGGDSGLIDGVRGTTNFASGEWQGYWGQDFIATVDLQRTTEIKQVGAGFLQNVRSWIWMPTHVEFEVSDDNVNFRPVADIKTDIPAEDMKEQTHDFTQNIQPVKARYIRVKAFNLGKIPAWHPGAGGNAYVFVDEILVG